jgi:hypothetical protein
VIPRHIPYEDRTYPKLRPSALRPRHQGVDGRHRESSRNWNSEMPFISPRDSSSSAGIGTPTTRQLIRETNRTWRDYCASERKMTKKGRPKIDEYNVRSICAETGRSTGKWSSREYEPLEGRRLVSEKPSECDERK